MFLERSILPLSLALLCFSNIFNVGGVPINSEDPSPMAIWVTETVWPCEPPSPLTLAAAETGNANSVSRTSGQGKGGYDTVPVDGSENVESVQVESSSPSSSVNSAADPADPSTSTSDPRPSTSDPGPTTSDPVPTPSDPAPAPSDPTVSTPTIVDTVAPSDPTTSAPSAILDAEATSSDPPAADTTNPVPMFPPSNYTGTRLVQPTLAPSNTTSANDTICSDDPATDDWTPEEESAYWATATGITIVYSDYTITTTVHLTSVSTIYTNITTTMSTTADPVPLIAVGTTSPTPSVAPEDTTTVHNAPLSANPDLIYTPVESSSGDPAAVQAATVTTSADPSVIMDASLDPLATESLETTTSSAVVPAVPMNPDTSSTHTAEDPTPSATITYLDVTTTTTNPVTATVTPSASFVPTSSDESTSTTTVWITSTIITDVNATLRRRMQLVTRR